MMASFGWTWPTLEQYGWLVAISLTGELAHVLTVEGLSRGDTHVVTPFDFFRLIWATLIGILLFGESVDNLVWIGGPVVIASVTYIARRERQIEISQTSTSEA